MQPRAQPRISTALRRPDHLAVKIICHRHAHRSTWARYAHSSQALLGCVELAKLTVTEKRLCNHHYFDWHILLLVLKKCFPFATWCHLVALVSFLFWHLFGLMVRYCYRFLLAGMSYNLCSVFWFISVLPTGCKLGLQCTIDSDSSDLLIFNSILISVSNLTRMIFAMSEFFHFSAALCSSVILSCILSFTFFTLGLKSNKQTILFIPEI